MENQTSLTLHNNVNEFLSGILPYVVSVFDFKTTARRQVYDDFFLGEHLINLEPLPEYWAYAIVPTEIVRVVNLHDLTRLITPYINQFERWIDPHNGETCYVIPFSALRDLGFEWKDLKISGLSEAASKSSEEAMKVASQFVSKEWHKMLIDLAQLQTRSDVQAAVSDYGLSEYRVDEDMRMVVDEDGNYLPY